MEGRERKETAGIKEEKPKVLNSFYFISLYLAAACKKRNPSIKALILTTCDVPDCLEQSDILICCPGFLENMKLSQKFEKKSQYFF